MIRERWAEVTNEALQRAGLTARVDHRSLEHQGVAREPVPTIPEKVFYAERKARGGSIAGDAIRARHRERVEARLKSGGDLARVLGEQKRERRERSIEDFKRRDAAPKRIRWNALTRAERNQHRRERYRARRAIEKQDPVREAQRREAARLAAEARLKRNPEVVRAAHRRWRQAHAEEVNRKQREYRLARAERSRSKSSSPTAAQSARNWKAYRESRASGPTAEESARGWRDLRENRPLPAPSPSATPHVREHGLEGASAGNQDAGVKPPKGQDYDFSL